MTIGKNTAVHFRVVTCAILINFGPSALYGQQLATDSELAKLKETVKQLVDEFTAFKTTNTEIAADLSLASKIVLPVGSIVAYAGQIDKIPSNWRPCNGDTVSTDDYPALWEVLNNVWGGVDEKHFKLPDLQGRFLRGVDGGTKRDTGIDERTPSGDRPKETVGSVQGDALQDHKHEDAGHDHPANFLFQASVGGGGGYGAAEGNQPDAKNPGLTGKSRAVIGGAISIDSNSPVRTASETRVKNAYVFWIIRVK